jgi:hypothetical protein
VSDKIYEGFLKRQFEEGLALAGASDLLQLTPLAPDRYVARFLCKGLVREADDRVVEASEFVVGIWFPSDYLRRAEPFQVISWLGPANVFHPNIRPPILCVGRLSPGTALVDILFQCFEIITYHNWAAHDGLNDVACQWARNHADRFPVDRRPLRRRKLALACDVSEKGGTQ